MIEASINDSQLQPIFIGITTEQFIKDHKTPERNALRMKQNQFAVSLSNKQYPFNRDSLHLEHNKSYLDQIVSNVRAIPSIDVPNLNLDTSIYEADTLPIQTDDPRGLKQDIHRFNRKIASWTCDHSNLYSLEIMYQHDLLALMSSENYLAVKQYLNDMAKAAIDIQNKDKRKMDYVYDFEADEFGGMDDVEDTGIEDRLLDITKAEKVRQAAIEFGREVLAFKAKYQRHQCPICAKRKKEYENMKQEIADRRADVIKEQEQAVKHIQASIDENIDDFMNQYFKNKDRLRLMDVVKMWKVVKKEMIKQKVIGSMLEETGNWTITNNRNIWYATRRC